MKKPSKFLFSTLSVISFLVLCLISILWFLLTYWEFPSYSSSTNAFLHNGASGINFIFVHILYFIAFSPLIIAIIVILIEYIFLKKRNKILKICFSLTLLFAVSITIIPFLAAQSNIYVSQFSTSNWTSIPKLRYMSVNNLIENHHLVGMSSNDLFNLLGYENYETETYNSQSYYWDLQNSLLINNTYLKITISNNIVTSYKIVK